MRSFHVSASITSIASCTLFYNWFMPCLIVILLLTELDSTAGALPVLVLLCEDTVRRMSHDFLIFDVVNSHVSLAVGAALLAALMAACLFCAHMFPVGTSSLGADLTTDLRFLCCLDFFFPILFAATRFVFTLGDAAAGTLRTCCVGALMDRVICWLGSGDSCHGPVAAAVCGTSPCVCSAGSRNILSAISAFVAIALSVRRCNCFISPAPCLFPIALIFAVIILSACAIVGLVMVLLLKCVVSVSCSCAFP